MQTQTTELPEDLEDAFVYLDELRESGVTNMYGAGDYLMRDQEYDRRTSRAVLSAWMNTFGDIPASDRALKARSSKPEQPA